MDVADIILAICFWPLWLVWWCAHYRKGPGA